MSPDDLRDALLELADEHHDTDPVLLQKRLARLAPTVDVVIRYRLHLELVRLREYRALLSPGSSDIPGGYECRKQADIQVENYDADIESVLSQLLPDEAALEMAS